MERLITSKPYNLNAQPTVEAHFATLSLEDLRAIQSKREEEEKKVDLSPECAFMENDKKSLDKLISAVVVDTVKARRKVGRPKKNQK